MLHKKHLVVIVILVSYLCSVDCVNYVDCDPSKASSEKSTSGCPINSQCVELGMKEALSTFGGLCACKVNYKFNRNYAPSDNNSLYCIEDHKSTPIPPTSTAAPVKSTEKPVTTTKTTTTTTTTKKPETLKTTSAPSPQVTTTKKVEPSTTKPSNESSNNNNSKNNNNNDKQPEQQKQVEKVETPTHHMFGGIVLPVMIVLAFMGAVYGIRKYDLLERAQNYIRNRRNGGQPHQTRYDGLENDFDDDPLLI